MIITSFDIYKYKLNLNSPFNIKDKLLDVREGFIIKISTDEGVVGLGEVAPLPGLSDENLDDALAELKRLKHGMFEENIPTIKTPVSNDLSNFFEDVDLYPSVRFGLEMAFIDCTAKLKKKPINEILSNQTHNKIRLHALLTGDVDDILKQARDYLDNGFTSFKLKVSADIDYEINRVIKLNQLLEGKALLHIDANQKWNLNGAIQFANEVGLTAIDYIEEPFVTTKDIKEFFEKTTIPVALDESILDNNFEEIKSIEGVDVLILKPTYLGGVEKTLQLMHNASSLAINSVISSSFESSLGINFLAHMAGSIPRDHTAGLDTLKHFKEDVLINANSIEHGKMNLQNEINFNDLNQDVLERIDS